VLLERVHELKIIDRLLDDAAAGEGAVLLVEGPPGIGKTALLDVARAAARKRKMTVLAGRGVELEGHFPYGVARQLYEPLLSRVPSRRRASLLAGAGRLAEPILLQAQATGGRSTNADVAFAHVHGLYWLTLNLSRAAPVLIAVDDAHLADGPSLRFLMYLTRRLDGVAAAVLASVRAGKAGAEAGLIAELAGEPRARVIRPAPLSEDAVAQVISAGLGQAPAAPFTVACRYATGGVPFLVHELVAALSEDRISPEAAQAPRVRSVGPANVARATVVRLSRMSAGCVELARAIAVLAGSAERPRAARLAGLDQQQALDALDALVSGHVVRTEPVLEFIHPIVRAAIYDDLPPGRRSRLHHRAAELLWLEGADGDTIAAQLLASDPIGSAEVAARLRAAAAEASARGAHEAAAAYLHRALAEGVPDVENRVAALNELATAEKLMRQPGAIGHFQEALRLADDPFVRARIVGDLVEILGFAGQWEPLIPMLDSALQGIGGGDREVSLRLETLRGVITAHQPALLSEFDERLPSLRAAAERAEGPARELSLMLSFVVAARGGDPDEVAGLVERGLDGGRLLADEGAECWALWEALRALVIVEHLDGAVSLTTAIADSAQRTGSLQGFVAGLAHRAWVDVRRGELTHAAVDLRAALESAREHDLQMPAPIILWFASDAILERPDLSDLAAAAHSLELPPGLATSLTGAGLLELRGRLRMQAGDAAGAIDDLRSAGGTAESIRYRNPNFLVWRSTLVPALVASDGAAARELAAAQLSDARRIGLPRGIGIALRTLAVLERGPRRRELLEQAADSLERSPARLEHARALVDLGAEMRRAGERSAAREPLRAGLDIAVAGGAVRLEERARAELAASGAHPRRPRLTGRDSLTPSELRVARLAADGHTNNEIAQALFVTPKTVDTHLSHVYAKLDISSRQLLAGKLGTHAE